MHPLVSQHRLRRQTKFGGALKTRFVVFVGACLQAIGLWATTHRQQAGSYKFRGIACSVQALSVCLSVCLSVWLSGCLAVWLSGCLFCGSLPASDWPVGHHLPPKHLKRHIQHHAGAQILTARIRC